MPRIPDEFLDSVVYVYSSQERAAEGAGFGGSGFLVGVPLIENIEWCAVYVVTNKHVILECGDRPAIRLNTVQGRWDVLETFKDDWVKHPQADDVAACPIELSREGLKFSFVHSDLFVKKEQLGNLVGVGDDTFMVGRFINVQGQERNTPAVRFGNIAVLPYEPVEVDGIRQESFLVECRSIPGYSGSPVFLFDPQRYRRGYTYLESWDNRRARGPWLLGIDWCHIHNFEPVFNVEKQGEIKTRNKNNELEARSNTSMAGVIPAWILTELLNEEIFVKAREVGDKELTQKKSQSVITADSAAREGGSEHN